MRDGSAGGREAVCAEKEAPGQGAGLGPRGGAGVPGAGGAGQNRAPRARRANPVHRRGGPGDTLLRDGPCGGFDLPCSLRPGLLNIHLLAFDDQR